MDADLKAVLSGPAESEGSKKGEEGGAGGRGEVDALVEKQYFVVRVCVK